MAKAKDTIDLETLVNWFEDAEDATRSERQLAERCRDFKDGAQWEPDQAKELDRRGQAPIVFNLVQQKVDFLVGVERNQRTDPRAYPRTPKHEGAANAMTDSIRYVCDNQDFDQTASEVFEDCAVEGCGGISVEVEEKADEIEITLKRIRWDRLVRDPHSLRRDFRDARYTGVVAWMDLDQATAMFGEEKAEEMTTQFMAHTNETYDDKPNETTYWYDRSRERVMLVDMYFQWNGRWHHGIFSRHTWLEGPVESPYLDEDGLPTNPHVLTSAYVSRDGQRYGPTKHWLDPQTEVNKRHSKALHFLTVRQTFSKQGMIEDLNAFKSEMDDPRGHVEFPHQGEFGRDFGVLPTNDLGTAQFSMYQDSLAFFDRVGGNAILAGREGGDMSGRALQQMQQGGLMELGALFDGHAHWKRRVYRAIWQRIKQYWDSEKWIRITDDENNLKYVGLNVPVTRAMQMVMADTGMSASDIASQYGDRLEMVYQANPMLAQTVDTENEVAEIDVDIVIEEVPDVVNLQSEQFEMLVKLYQANPQGIPWEDIVEMSSLRNKDKILGRDDPEREARMQQQQQAQEMLQQMAMRKAGLELVRTEAEVRETQAKAAQMEQKAIQTYVETDLLTTGAPPDKVAII